MTAINFVPSYEDRPPFQCPLCKRWFIKTRNNISCTVQHAPGTCCHLYDLEVDPPAPTWWEKTLEAMRGWF